MNSGNEIGQLGKRIKELRIEKDLKLVEVALNAQISKGLLSKIENGRAIPSLPVLFSIITAINESPASFFAGMQKNGEIPFYQLIRKEEYQSIEKEDSVGFNYFSIMAHNFSEITFSAVYLELLPCSKREMVTTEGMEFIFLIKGQIDYLICQERFTMFKGDSLFFDGRSPHLKINTIDETAEILVFYFLFNKSSIS